MGSRKECVMCNFMQVNNAGSARRLVMMRPIGEAFRLLKHSEGAFSAIAGFTKLVKQAKELKNVLGSVPQSSGQTVVNEILVFWWLTA
jgi:hypothetical protein